MPERESIPICEPASEPVRESARESVSELASVTVTTLFLFEVVEVKSSKVKFFLYFFLWESEMMENEEFGGALPPIFVEEISNVFDNSLTYLHYHLP